MFLTTIKTKLLAAAGGLLAVIVVMFAAFLRGRKSKADEVQAETAKTIIKTVKKGKSIETANRNSGAAARRKRLRGDTSDTE